MENRPGWQVAGYGRRVTDAAPAAYLRHVSAVPWRSILRRELPQVARIVLVAAVSWQICVLLGAVAPPVFAVVVPLVSLRDDPFSAFSVSIARLVGVVAGLLIAIGVLQVLTPGAVAIAAVMAAALLVGVVLRVGNVLNTQVAVSALLVFSSADASGYAVTRLWETGVGTATTLALAPLLFPTDPLAAARADLARVAAELVGTLRATATVVGRERGDDTERRTVLRRVLEDLVVLNTTLQQLGTQIATARKSARWTILRRSAMRATGDLEPTRQLALRLARHAENFVEEAMAFDAHPDVGRDPTLRADQLDRLVQPLESCLVAALAARPFADDLDRACAAVEDFRTQEHSRVASVLRRPLHRMVEDLAAF